MQSPSSHSSPSSSAFPPGLQSSREEKPSFPRTGVPVLTQLRVPQFSLLEAPWSYQTSVIARVALPGAREARSKGSTTSVPREQFCRVRGAPQKNSSELGARVLAKRGGESKGGIDPPCMAQGPLRLCFRANLVLSRSFSPPHAPYRNGDEHLGCQSCVGSSRHSEMQDRARQRGSQSRNQTHKSGLQRRRLATSMNADELERQSPS